MGFLALLVLPVLVIASNTFAQPTPAVSADVIILDRLLQGYDWRVGPRPIGPRGPIGGPANVSVNIYIRKLKLIDDTMEVEVTFRQSWNDNRLAYSHLFPDGHPLFILRHPLDKTERRIWMPDTFFQNAYHVQTHEIPSPNELLRIYNDGSVLSSQKLSFKIPCISDGGYPHDTQRCYLDLASYGYTTDDIEYSWKNEYPIQLKDGISVSPTLQESRLNHVIPDYCTSRTNTGTYSCLRLALILKRESTSLSLTVCIIPMLLAVLSLLPIILNVQSIHLRVIIGFFCLSTLILHWGGGNSMPKFGHSGAEEWMIRSLVFIIATLVQLIFYVWIMRISDALKERKLGKERLTLSQKKGILEMLEEPVVPKRKMSLSLLIDMISLGIFVLALLAFLTYHVIRMHNMG